MRVGTWAWRVAALLLTFAPMSLAQPAAYAQSPAEFYKGRNVELYIGYSVGGAYDLYARVLARHLSKHIPGRSEEHTSELQSRGHLVCRLLLEKKKKSRILLSTPITIT